MRLDSCKQLIGLVSVTSLVILTGCATQGPTPDSTNAQSAAVTSTPADQSSPSIPVTAATVVPVEEKKVVATPPEPGSMASVVKKMNKNPFTLYWREKDSYSYHVGSSLDAEYKPGTGLTVKALQAEKSVVCEFDSSGKLVNAAKTPGSEDQCSKIMFTLDAELGE